MLRRLALVLLVPVPVGACGGGGSDDPGDGLADRVVAVLEAEGDAVDGDLEGAEVTCPDVGDAAAGDRATCTVRFDGGGAADVDVEFEADGAITVVAVVPR